MNPKTKILRNLLPFFASILVAFQSLAPAAVVWAQEASPSPSDQPATQTESPTASPSVEPSVASSPAENPSHSETRHLPQLSVAPSDSPSPADQPQSSDNPNQTDQSTPNVSDTNSNNQSASPPPPSGEPSPSPSPEEDTNGDEHVSVDLVTDTNNPSSPIEAFGQPYAEPSAFLSTDKNDYSPTESAVISGSGFDPNTSYTLVISSQDPPAVNFETGITTNDQGSFTYTYQLDGNYRPNYKVEVKDSTGVVVATTTFTDTDTTFKIPTSTHIPNNWDTNAVANAQNSDDEYISDNDEGDIQGYSTFGFPSIPVGSTINGIEVKLEAKSSDSSGCSLFGTLSWNNGTSDTSAKSNALTGLDSIFTLGDASDTWGRTWASTDFTDGNFVVKIYFDDTSGNTCQNSTVSVDQLQVKVTYTDPPASPYTFTNDSAGANDEPGQKDLTRFGKNLSATNPLDIVWNWDVTSMPGNNTADGCALFDTDGDGNANYALCVTWGGSQDKQDGSPTLYSCNDSRVDRCAGSTLVPTFSSECDVTNTTDDPFGAGDSAPNDTRASCKIPLSDVGEASANLLDVCSYPSTQPNSDPSDCVVVQTNKGNITIVKDVSPDNANTNWNFAVTGPTSFNTSIAGDGTSGVTSVDLGTYSITETAEANTNLSDYTTTWSCTKNGSAYLSGNGAIASNLVIGASQGAEDSIVCTFTNTLQTATITVNKILSPSNDLGKFNLQIDDQTAGTGANVGNGGTTGAITVSTSSQHTVSETAEPGTSLSDYTTTYTCDNNLSGSGTSVGPFSVTSNQNVVCTFTNTRNTGSVKVNKLVDRDDDGHFEDLNPQDFNWSLDGSGTNSMGGTVSGVNTGNHSVDENSVTNYHFIGWYPTNSTFESCSKPTGISLPVTVSVGNNQTTEITLCNAIDTGTLRVIKEVINDNGGTALSSNFNLHVKNNGSDVSNSPAPGSATGTVYTLPVGSYVVSEDTPPSGYTQTGFTGDCDGSGQVSVVSGQEVTCTITNDDNAPSLTLVKEVRGGTSAASDWTLSATGPTSFNGPGPSVSSDASFDAGAYDLSESGPPDYTAASWICVGGNQQDADTVVVGLGEVVTCTLTNTRDTGTITVIKDVDPNDNSQWDIDISGPSPNSDTLADGDSTDPLTSDTGIYTISETAGNNTDASDYNSAYSCTESGQVIASGSGTTISGLTLAKDQDIVCTFTNKIKRGNVVVTKYHDRNANGVQDEGEETLDGWEIWLDQSAQFTGAQTPGQVEFSDLLPGPYELSEQIKETWHQSNISCEGDEGIDNDNSHVVTVNPDETVQCKIGNYQNGTITVEKRVIDPDGNDVDNDSMSFDFNIDGFQTSLSDGQSIQISRSPGIYEVTETPKENYDFIGCEAQTETESDQIENGIAVVLASSDSISVLCTNQQRTGSIEGTKWNDENGDGRRGEENGLGQWHIRLFENNDGSVGNQVGDDAITDENGNYIFPNVNPGTYWVCEVQQSGWIQTYPNNDSQNPNCWLVEISSGGSLSDRDFGNRFVIPVLQISKQNNAVGDQGPGSNVQYTITLRVLDNDINDVKVTDLLPGDFVYRSGSWSVTVNGASVSVPEPLYASPGVWNLGNLSKGDEVVMTLIADIASSIDPGLYKDVAWAQGTAADSTSVLAIAVDPGDLDSGDSNFVGTDVNVVVGNQSSASHNVENKQEGQVLGAKTELPSTGASTNWLILAILSLTIGTALTVTGFKLKKKHV